MATTYEQYITDCKQDIRNEGYEPDHFIDVAESMLHSPTFHALAVKKFGKQTKSELKVCVANDLF